MQQLSGHKLLLLGGEGFIGRNIAEYFSAKNTCLSVGSEQSLFTIRNDQFLLRNPYEEVVEHTSDVIIHLIDNKVAAETFLEQERKLIENIHLSSSHHLVVFSSAILYVNLDSEYGQRKQMLERFYTEYCKEHGIPLTILRLFNTYGPYQIPYRQGSLVANLICNFLEEKETEIQDREARRDFLYAGDIPKFIEYVIANKIAGVHDIGSGNLVALGALIALLEESILKKNLSIVYRNNTETAPSRFAQGDLVGKIDGVSLEEGLSNTVTFYEHNMSIVKHYGK
jgi:nucleoside-diphosphate-sugar epimerase